MKITKLRNLLSCNQAQLGWRSAKDFPIPKVMKLQTFRSESEPQAALRYELAIRKAMLVYPDTEAGLRARHTLENLPPPMKLMPSVEIKFWRHDLLSLPWLREQAAVDGSNAGLIIISVDAPGETPAEVEDWMKRWLERRTSVPCALVVLVPANSLGKHRQHPTAIFARRIAERANAIFFCFVQAESELFVQEPQFKEDRYSRPDLQAAAAGTNRIGVATAVTAAFA